VSFKRLAVFLGLILFAGQVVSFGEVIFSDGSFFKIINSTDGPLIPWYFGNIKSGEDDTRGILLSAIPDNETLHEISSGWAYPSNVFSKPFPIGTNLRASVSVEDFKGEFSPVLLRAEYTILLFNSSSLGGKSSKPDDTFTDISEDGSEDPIEISVKSGMIKLSPRLSLNYAQAAQAAATINEELPPIGFDNVEAPLSRTTYALKLFVGPNNGTLRFMRDFVHYDVPFSSDLVIEDHELYFLNNGQKSLLALFPTDADYYAHYAANKSRGAEITSITPDFADEPRYIIKTRETYWWLWLFPNKIESVYSVDREGKVQGVLRNPLPFLSSFKPMLQQGEDLTRINWGYL